MIKILILSRSDLHHSVKNIPQEYLNVDHLNNEAYMLIGQYHYAFFQESDGPVTILKDRGDINIKRIIDNISQNLE